jgi:hypothetical protein
MLLKKFCLIGKNYKLGTAMGDKSLDE